MIYYRGPLCNLRKGTGLEDDRIFVPMAMSKVYIEAPQDVSSIAIS
jgi:hypothetical protein